MTAARSRGAGLTFGLALDLGAPGRSLRQVADGLQPIVDLAERRRFASLWVGEIYAPTPGAWAAPSSLAMLSWLAARTTTIGLGTGVLLVPAWHPLRLAYEAAVVDQLSAGRLTLGVGLGSRELWRRFGRDGVPGALMDATLNAVRALWTGSDGHHHDGLDIDGPVHPRPCQAGGPPILVGGLAPAAARRAARFDGWYAATNHHFGSQLRPAARRYLDALETTDPSKPPKIVVNRMAFAADTTKAALADGLPYVTALLEKYAALGGLVDEDGNPAKPTRDVLARMADSLCLIGSPERISEQLAEYRQAGVTHVNLRVSFGGMPVELTGRTVNLIADSVMGQGSSGTADPPGPAAAAGPVAAARTGRTGERSPDTLEKEPPCQKQ
ncbi:LLM class flavin-dependent oxidoreductase [Actinomadura sp. KC216]|uniref:LLM class flavin-dependent oxidoreductase n=1 Tax=Actinomadura sp. KC216 TaxID=2530370 RepID=UPI001404785D|nr:LLM class flavin-dependent oxidoreductase [Actinomadura sp. KC216]